MNVNGIGSYGGFANYKVVDIPKVDLEAVKKQDADLAAKKASELYQVPVVEAPKAESVVEVEDNRSRTANLEDISLTFNTGDDFSFLGNDFEIGNLDMQQAISDMRKDKILEDYNYFVGSSENLTKELENEDGKVFLKF